jgi:hypothetical protein
MNRFIRYAKSTSLRLKWIFMSPRGRYAYLWAKTRRLGGGGSSVRYTAAIAHMQEGREVGTYREKQEMIKRLAKLNRIRVSPPAQSGIEMAEIPFLTSNLEP